MREGSVGFCRCDTTHQSVDLAGRDRHDDSLDRANFLFVDALCLGHAKVVNNSWSAFPGDRRRQADDGNCTFIQVSLAAYGIVKIAIGFVRSGRQHLLFHSISLHSRVNAVACRSLCSKIVKKMQENRPEGGVFHVSCRVSYAEEYLLRNHRPSLRSFRPMAQTTQQAGSDLAGAFHRWYKSGVCMCYLLARDKHSRSLYLH